MTKLRAWLAEHGVFAAGGIVRGARLAVRAIRDGRDAAASGRAAA